MQKCKKGDKGGITLPVSACNTPESASYITQALCAAWWHAQSAGRGP